jgi:hypothetical protein
MISWKRAGLIVTASVAVMFLGDIGKQQAQPLFPSFVATAEARVGRPLTPVSVAGAARRTTRRCAAGVYNC